MKLIRALQAIGLLVMVLPACRDSTAPKGDSGSSARRLIAGEEVPCALTSSGAVLCWGVNSSFWEYGAAPTTIPGGGFPVAAQVPALSNMARGVGTHFCGITSTKDAVCWARNNGGQLGSGVVGNPGDPASIVSGAIHWTDIAVGRLTTCGVSDTGVGYCWGYNQRSEIGSASVPIGALTPTPHPVDGGLTFKTIATGWVHACGITITGAVYCWGNNGAGQLGIGTTDTLQHPAPTPIVGALKFVQLSLGSIYTCGLTEDGTAYCWGMNATGQLGDGTHSILTVPTLVAGGLKFSQIVASSGFSTGALAVPPTTVQGAVGHTCALTTDGKPYCWGWNGNGELGDGTTVDKLTPTAVSGGLSLSTIAVGGAYTCGMQGDNVWCWGSNFNGQIGKGDVGGLSVTPHSVLPPFGPP